MEILDTTIRDGGYSVDFKFNTIDVKNIVTKLVKLNIKYIEIGHGLGLNASSPERGIAFCSDEEYIDAAKTVSGDSQLGVFCIPGIAQIKDLYMAKEHGISFIRIGVRPDQVDSALEYIHKAREIGLTVMVNFMKTYAETPQYVAQKAKAAVKEGAQYIYIVDSAGCMLPEELTDYINEIKKISPNVKMGFHGHNNLGLAVSNSIHCVDMGIELIDCSFQGIGRSIGNASTEQFVMALERKFGKNYINIDVPRLLEYGYVLLKNITDRQLQNPLDLLCGYTGFHSGFLKDIYRCCCELNVDPMRLIIAYSDIDKKEMNYNKLCELAKELPSDDFESHPYSFRQFFTTKYIE